MAERMPEGIPEEEKYIIQGTPAEPTLEPSEHFVPYAPPPGNAPARNDLEIQHDIESALFRDDLVRSFEIQVAVQGGNVTLSGSVGDPMERNEAERLACRVPGVKCVDNQIQTRQ
ncbi:MAG: BON domain-containing protein [Chloroflexi bacterium]|nr:BON domain-containing protein [Chloroflexota bacterium]